MSDKNAESSVKFKTSIGGQALIEGIIMLLMSVKLLHITVRNSKARKAAKEAEKA